MAKYKQLYEQSSVMLAKYQDELIPQYRKIIEELEADNERLRDMWAKAVSDASKEQSNRVEVVRCKDCQYLYSAEVNDQGFLICKASNMDITPNDYCSYGEREVE